jgi:hypothetical protein
MADYTAQQGATVVVADEITNTGDASGDQTIELLRDGGQEDSRSNVTLNAGETDTGYLTLDTSGVSTGTYTIKTTSPTTPVLRSVVSAAGGLHQRNVCARRVTHRRRHRSTTRQTLQPGPRVATSLRDKTGASFVACSPDCVGFSKSAARFQFHHGWQSIIPTR